jgi:hypothetical protein
MYLPYDVYEPQLDCQYFGAITVETALHWNPKDNVYIVGRDLDYRQKLLNNEGVKA